MFLSSFHQAKQPNKKRQIKDLCLLDEDKYLKIINLIAGIVSEDDSIDLNSITEFFNNIVRANQKIKRYNQKALLNDISAKLKMMQII